MRLWHKDLIEVLPRKQLLGQWRECCLIAKGLSEGTLNHLLVNKVKEYPFEHFVRYSQDVAYEMLHRGYRCDVKKFNRYIKEAIFVLMPSHSVLFADWHNDRYLRQCYYNLEEKYDCGGISDEKWQDIYKKIMMLGTNA